jgi:phospholipid N-methyltransferase
MTKEEVLQKCTIEGFNVKLPDVNLDRKVYLEVSKSLELIGGKWTSGKIKAFVFKEDPTELLSQIANGDKRNLKKEFQYFETPPEIADFIVKESELKENQSVLEPSAGQGAIVKAINRLYPNKKVSCYELMPVNQTILKKIDTVDFLGEDFLNTDNKQKFEVIISNPPFSKNQDITHVREMYERLEFGGKLVAITSKHWELSTNKKETEFREWLKDVYAEELDIPAGSFKESGTQIATKILIINKYY